MSNVNIKRAVDNIRAGTTVYSPIVEVVVNAIQAIDEAKVKHGKVDIRVQRSSQLDIIDGLADISSIVVQDNGIGFTKKHRGSFDTLYSDLKYSEGGKGFGRFVCLKYFEDVHVESVFLSGKARKCRKFSMGKEKKIIVNESVTVSGKATAGTKVTLSTLRTGRDLDKKLQTIARNLVEKLLPYFITENYVCPVISLSEWDGSGAIELNGFVSNELAGTICELPMPNGEFTLNALGVGESFRVRVFRVYYAKNQKSKISLVAHRREVTGSPLYKYIPEFSDDFFDRDVDGEANRDRNYIVKAYVFGSYLDRHVSVERGAFEFRSDRDMVLGISQSDIEERVAGLARDVVGDDILVRQAKKREAVQTYVDGKAPWHKTLIASIDLSGLAFNPSEEDIEARLQSEKYLQEAQIRKDVSQIIASAELGGQQDRVQQIVGRISDTSKSDLVHYVALRRYIVEILGKSLEKDPSGKYRDEGVAHDVIFPRGTESDTLPFENHNLWLLDERLNFTSWVSSDRPMNGPRSPRPDILVYDRRVLFRGDNDASNPVTIFEFKRPGRDDFTNPSSNDNPIDQIVRYTNDIRGHKVKTPEGRPVEVTANTPFYGYVVCDLTDKVLDWLEFTKDFTPMPDRRGWFRWYGSIRLYIEVLSWDKVLTNAKSRNGVFFAKLKI